MADGSLINIVLVPLGLGLLGFVEPCSIATALLFLKYVEGRPAREKVLAASLYTLSRAAFTGALGALAALIGALFLPLQQGLWIALGAVFAGIGVLYLARRQELLLRLLAPLRLRQGTWRGPIGLGVAFGLNLPACAAPLLAGMIGVAAAGSGGQVAAGFFALAVFGLALSLPLVAAMIWPWARDRLDRLAALSERMPFATGLVFLALGAWSAGTGLFATSGDIVLAGPAREEIIAWAVLIFGIALPAAHVVFAPGAGGWSPRPGSGARCPFGPRLGWLIVVTFLPFVGWLMFVAAKRRRGRSGPAISS